MQHSNSSYTTLRIHWPERGCHLTLPTNGGMAHRLAAKAVGLHGEESRCHVDPIFFHHVEHKGTFVPAQGLSMMRYEGRPDSMAITAVGDEATEALEDDGHRLVRCIAKMAGKPLKETWTTGAVRVRVSNKVYRYRIPYLVVSRKSLRDIDVREDLLAHRVTEAVKSWIGEAILHGIQRQADTLGLDVPESDVALLSVHSVGGTLGFFSEFPRGCYGSAARAVEFEANLDLSGPWSVGALCLHGEGRVLRDSVAYAKAA